MNNWVPRLIVQIWHCLLKSFYTEDDGMTIRSDVRIMERVTNKRTSFTECSQMKWTESVSKVMESFGQILPRLDTTDWIKWHYCILNIQPDKSLREQVINLNSFNNIWVPFSSSERAIIRIWQTKNCLLFICDDGDKVVSRDWRYII